VKVRFNLLAQTGVHVNIINCFCFFIYPDEEYEFKRDNKIKNFTLYTLYDTKKNILKNDQKVKRML
jgi:hypothetical protein